MLHRFAHALLDRRPEVLWDRAAEDLVFPDEPGAAWDRSNVDHTVAVQTGPAGLLLVLLLRLGAGGDRFLVGHPRHGQRALYPVFALHLLEHDVEMDIAHAVHDRLLRDRLVLQRQGRVFIDQLDQRRVDLFFVRLVLGAHGGAVGLLWILDRRGQLADARDIAGHHLGGRFQRLALRIADRAGALRLVLGRVQERGARRQDAGHHLDITDPAHEGVGGGFEDDGSQRPGRLARQGLGLLGARIDGHNWRGLPGGREERHDGIEQGADADRFARGRTEDRDDCPGRHALRERPCDLSITQLPTLEVFLEQRVVRLGGRLHERRPPGLDLGGQVARHGDLLGASLLIELIRLTG